MTLHFNFVSKLDEGCMWPFVFALTELTAAESRIALLMKKAVAES
jgi:hypothetical protein